MNEIWERVLANSFSGIHKSKIICSAPVQYLKNRSHGQNLRSTVGQAEPIVQYFFKNSTTGPIPPCIGKLYTYCTVQYVTSITYVYL
jgi:hypothetical protein